MQFKLSRLREQPLMCSHLDIDDGQISVTKPHDSINVLNVRAEERPECAPEASSSCLPIAGVIGTPNSVHVPGKGLIQRGHA